MAAVTAACGRPDFPDVSTLRLATGPEGATYRESGAALANLWNEALAAPIVRTVHTDAGVDNARMLLAHEVDIGYSNVDVLRPSRDAVAALLRVFDSVVHLVALRDSGIRELTDLPGRRVAMGLPGSGTRFTAQRLLAAAGVPIRSETYAQQSAVQALADGAVDAVFSLTAMPTPAISWLLANAPPIRFIDLGTQVESMQRAHPGEYLPVTISSTVYPGVATTHTVAVPTLITVRPEFPFDLARFLTRTAIEGAGVLARTRPEAHQINPRTGAATAPIPLHPGSAAWFRETKP